MKTNLLTTCLLGCILQLSMVSIVHGLSCYQCDSADDLRCSEELISQDLRSLPCDTLSEARFCVKMTGIFGAGALKCYQCSSVDEYTCGEFFSTSETAVELSECHLSDPKYCVKTTGIYDGNLGSRRFCSERYLDNYCTYVQRPGDQREYRSCVYTCTGDGCNGSNSLHPFTWLLVSSLMIFISTTFVTFPPVY